MMHWEQSIFLFCSFFCFSINQSIKSSICKAPLKRSSQRRLLWVGLHKEPSLKARLELFATNITVLEMRWQQSINFSASHSNPSLNRESSGSRQSPAAGMDLVHYRPKSEYLWRTIMAAWWQHAVLVRNAVNQSVVWHCCLSESRRASGL